MIRYICHDKGMRPNTLETYELKKLDPHKKEEIHHNEKICWKDAQDT